MALLVTVIPCFAGNMNGDVEGNDTKKRPTTVIQKLHELQISDSEPEVKKRMEMSSENIRRGAHEMMPDEIPGHVCGQGDIGQGEILFDDVILPEELCVSGRKVALKPYTTNCGHTYCGEEIEAMKRMNMQTFKCVGKDEDSPNNLCQEVVIVDNLKLDRALDRNINRKVVRCSKFKSSGDGCNKTVQHRRLKHHLENDCQFADVPCPNCNRDVPRRELDQHLGGCRSKACGFSSIGCHHVSEPDDAASSSFSRTPSPIAGEHFSLMYQASIRSASEFSASTLNSTVTRHSQSVTCQEQALHMLAHPDEQKADEMNIQELDSQYKAKREEAQNTLDSYNRCVHMEYPLRIAEPVQRLRKRGQWLEAQEEEVNESMAKFMRETNEAPILLNQGSMIFKLMKFSEKRMKAIKGELKRRVYGSRLVFDNLDWIFHPSFHGISSAVPSPPSYITDVVCYISSELSDVHCPLSKTRLQQLKMMSSSMYLDEVRHALPENQLSWLMTQEPQRKKTFLAEWPHINNLSGDKMAQAGFYHSEGYDCARCVYCGLILKGWKVENNPITEHIKFFPLCSFVQWLQKEAATDVPTDALLEPTQETQPPGDVGDAGVM